MKKRMLFCFLCSLIGCTNIERVDTTTVKEHMGDYKIKKVTSAEIIAQAEKVGGDFATQVEKQFNNADLISSVNCDFSKFPFNDTLTALGAGRARLIRKDDMKNRKSFLPKELEVLEAYQFSFEKNQGAGTNIQQIGDTLFLFTYPVSPQSPFTKSCVSGDPDGFAVVEMLLNKSFLVKKIR